MTHEELVNRVLTLNQITERLTEQNTVILLASLELKDRISSLEIQLGTLEHIVLNLRRS